MIEKNGEFSGGKRENDCCKTKDKIGRRVGSVVGPGFGLRKAREDAYDMFPRLFRPPEASVFCWSYVIRCSTFYFVMLWIFFFFEN